MILLADSVEVCPEDENYLSWLYMVDRSRDCCFSLSRFSDPVQDTGMVEVMIRDQIVAKTRNLTVVLEPTRLRATLDEETSKSLLGEREVLIHFQVDGETLVQMAEALTSMFRSLSGLTIQL